MSVNLNHLAIFHAVAQAGSMTLGAERLDISQPAVSKQAQGEPAPWAGYSGTASGSGARAVRSERNSARANPGVWSAPSRSGRPTESAKRKSPLKKPQGFPFSVAR